MGPYISAAHASYNNVWSLSENACSISILSINTKIFRNIRSAVPSSPLQTLVFLHFSVTRVPLKELLLFCRDWDLSSPWRDGFKIYVHTDVLLTIFRHRLCTPAWKVSQVETLNYNCRVSARVLYNRVGHPWSWNGPVANLVKPDTFKAIWFSFFKCLPIKRWLQVVAYSAFRSNKVKTRQGIDRQH